MGKVRKSFGSFVVLVLFLGVFNNCQSTAGVSSGGSDENQGFAAPITVEIDLSQQSVTSLKQGVLNGPTEYLGRTPTSDAANLLMQSLKPKSWRFSGIHSSQNAYGYGGNLYKLIVEDYNYPALHGTNTILNLQDIFNAKHGRPVRVAASCPGSSKDCFTSFNALRQAWQDDLRNFLIDTSSANITYFDLLAEAELNSFINISFEEIYFLMKDAYDLVKLHRPSVKIVGPSNSTFNQNIYDGLLSFLARDGVRLDAISWHELGEDPDVIASHLQTLKSLLQKYPGLCVPACPEFHINEYQGENSMLIPGRTVGWLYQLEAAKIHQAHRAVWEGDPGSPINYSSCWNGFSGLLTPDYSAPQALYWIYKSYADLGSSRYSIVNIPPKFAAISGPLPGGKIGLLLSNYGAAPGAPLVKLVNFGAAQANIETYKISQTKNEVSNVPQWPLLRSQTASRDLDSLNFSLPSLSDGEVYWVVIDP